MYAHTNCTHYATDVTCSSTCTELTDTFCTTGYELRSDDLTDHHTYYIRVTVTPEPDFYLEPDRTWEPAIYQPCLSGPAVMLPETTVCKQNRARGPPLSANITLSYYNRGITMSKSTEEKLLPCPFCGGDPIYYLKASIFSSRSKSWDIRCTTDGCLLALGSG